MDGSLPEEVELAGTGAVMRRYRSDDLDGLQAAIEASRDHLRPFMFWADQEREATGQFLTEAVADWAAGRNFNYVVLDDADGTVLGAGGLHRRSEPDILEIGYWRRVDAGGRGLVTTMARALTDIGLAVPGINRVEIHCDVANTASAAVPQRLGYELIKVIDKDPLAPAESGRHQVWSTVPPDPA